MDAFSDAVSLGRFTIERDKDRVLECEIFEEWRPIIHDLVRCGATQSHKLVRKIGVERSEAQVIETALKASVGFTGFANFQSDVKAKIQQEVRLNEETTTERVVTFTSPKCGHYRALQYQAVRTYRLKYEDKRWLHRDSWSQTFTEYTPRFHDASKSVPFDPDCLCKEDTSRDYDGLVMMNFGNLSKVVGFHELDNGFLFDLDQDKVVVQLADAQSGIVSIPAESLSEAVLFLLNAPGIESFRVGLTPYGEFQVRIIEESQRMVEGAGVQHAKPKMEYSGD